MGSFHCPMGAAFYDDDDCIDCGMCTATTREERVEATKKVRAYLQAGHKQDARISKIAITGKGGVGKSSTTALMATIFKEKGYRVSVLDTDESNPGLHLKLGLDTEPIPLMAVLADYATEKATQENDWITGESIALQDIPRQYVQEKEGLQFLMSGKIADPFQGCACSIADVTRKFVSKLRLSPDELLIIDMEAGIESFGRGVERNVDTILAVVEPSYDSIVLAEKIYYMAQGMGITRFRAVLNKIPSEKARQRIIEELTQKKIQTIGAVYFDLELNEAGFEGKPLPDSKATDQMRVAVNALLQ